MTKEIVIAAYDKDLSWTNKLNNNIIKTVYRKGDILPTDEGEIKLKTNLGRCVHTFFNHIYQNYNNLSDYTFFVQDFPFDHWGNLIEVINGNPEVQKASLHIGGYYGFHNNTIGTAWKMPPSTQFDSGNVLSCFSNGRPQDHNPLIDVDKYWGLIFEGNHPPLYEFIPGGHFTITKEHVRLRSRELYKQICDLLTEDVNAPWMIERLECYIFNPKYSTKL
tara:strand:+ start:407 stop:1066 length:660 start_codon:yes stop_codon:yes gene_type:complete